MHHRTMKLLARPLCAALLVLSTATWAAVSRDDAAAMAERASGGRVLSVERTDSGGRPAWRVKVVTGRGEVRVIVIDADSGQPR
jgi:uncharacterized membrane protein YkoI